MPRGGRWALVDFGRCTDLSRRPGSPDPQLSAQEASRPRASQRAGPVTRLSVSPHSLGIRDRTTEAGLRGSHATGATPPKPCESQRASPTPEALPDPRPRPRRAGPAPAAFRFPAPRGQPPLRSWPGQVLGKSCASASSSVKWGGVIALKGVTGSIVKHLFAVPGIKSVASKR